jgi:hypothetical protein
VQWGISPIRVNYRNQYSTYEQVYFEKLLANNEIQEEWSGGEVFIESFPIPF